MRARGIARLIAGRRGVWALAILATVASLLLREQVSGMDDRFFQWSPDGMQGLVRYLAGDYGGAARAYRAHFGLSTSGPAPAAANAIERAAALTRRREDGRALHALNLALRDGPATGAGELILALETAGELAGLPDETRPDALLAAWYRYLRVFDPGNGRPAIRAARRAIAAGARADDAYLTIGVIHARERRRERALAALLKAIEVNPRHAEALRWAGVVYGQKGDLANEYRMARAASEAEPGDPYYVEDLAFLVIDKLGDFRQAVVLLERALRSSPEDVNVLSRLAHAYGFLGDHARSVELYRRAIRLDPRNPRLLEGIGWVLDWAGRSDEAIAEYRGAAALAPGRPSPHRLLAVAYQRAGRHHEAIGALVRALELGERMSGTHEQLCRLYHLTSQFARAEACVRALLEREPRNPWGAYLLAEVRKNL